MRKSQILFEKRLEKKTIVHQKNRNIINIENDKKEPKEKIDQKEDNNINQIGRK